MIEKDSDKNCQINLKHKNYSKKASENEYNFNYSKNKLVFSTVFNRSTNIYVYCQEGLKYQLRSILGL
jgi:hypothetical protein